MNLHHSFLTSESKSINHTDHHDVSDGGDDGDPKPDGVTGHVLLLVVLGRCWGWGRRVHARWRVKERMFRAAVICVHERSAHHWKLKSHNTHNTCQKIQQLQKKMWEMPGCCYVWLLGPLAGPNVTAKLFWVFINTSIFHCECHLIPCDSRTNVWNQVIAGYIGSDGGQCIVGHHQWHDREHRTRTSWWKDKPRCFPAESYIINR